MRVLGNYELLRQIGRGGSGTVYLARHTADQSQVAIKVLAQAAVDSAPQRERFWREARALAQLRHPSIVALREVGEQQGRPFLVLEYQPGGTLEDRCEREPLPIEEALTLGVALASALQAVHALGILHRDLKPANVLFGPGGRPLLTDFGLVKSHSSGEASLTNTGAFLGTPGYLSPEQANGETSTVTTDVYGWGATLFAALCGRPPVVAETLVESLNATANEPAPRVRSLRSEAPKALAELVDRCLSKLPSERPQSATEVLDALLRVPDRARVPWIGILAATALVLVGLLGALALPQLLAQPGPGEPAAEPPAEPTESAAVETPNEASAARTDLFAAGSQAWKERRYHDAKELLTEAAASGDPRALTALGVVLIQGPEDVRDLAAGAECWRQAAELGHPTGMANYGVWLLANAPKDLRDRPLGVSWLRKAAEAGDLLGMVNLAQALLADRTADPTEGLTWYEAAAARGEVRAMVALGKLCVEGRGGLTDLARAELWFKRAAAGGSPEGMIHLGLCLERRGESGMTHYRAAAQAEDPEAMFHLARNLLLKGTSRQESDEGYRWLQEAAERGHRASMNNLGLVLSGSKAVRVPGVAVDLPAAERWFRSAAENGHPGAALSLGMALCKEGRSAEDRAEARRWFQAATQSPDPRVAKTAQERLRALSAQ